MITYTDKKGTKKRIDLPGKGTKENKARRLAQALNQPVEVYFCALWGTEGFPGREAGFKIMKPDGEWLKDNEKIYKRKKSFISL